MAAKHWYEDYEPGEVVRAQTVTVTKGMIVDFAFRWDPQPFHVDEQAGAANPAYGGLISSGWMTALLGYRLLVQAGVLGQGSLGSPGLEDLRFTAPVRPDDTLHPSVCVLDKRESQSKTDRGVVRLEWRIDNQRGERVVQMRSIQLILKRPA